jgi:hypothetical protein
MNVLWTLAAGWLVAIAAPWLFGLMGAGFGRIAAWLLLILAAVATILVMGIWIYLQFQPHCVDDADGEATCISHHVSDYLIMAFFPVIVGLSAALKLYTNRGARMRLTSQHSQ